jgi:hypothetical protein
MPAKKTSSAAKLQRNNKTVLKLEEVLRKALASPNLIITIDDIAGRIITADDIAGRTVITVENLSGRIIVATVDNISGRTDKK